MVIVFSWGLQNFYGSLHGGSLAAVCEMVSIACARTVVAEDKDIFLGDMSISYLSGAPINVSFFFFGGGGGGGLLVTHFVLLSIHFLCYLLLQIRDVFSSILNLIICGKCRIFLVFSFFFFWWDSNCILPSIWSVKRVFRYLRITNLYCGLGCACDLMLASYFCVL